MAIKRARVTRAYLFGTNIKGEVNHSTLERTGSGKRKSKGKTERNLGKRRGREGEKKIWNFSEARNIVRPWDYWLGKELHKSIHT